MNSLRYAMRRTPRSVAIDRNVTWGLNPQKNMGTDHSFPYFGEIGERVVCPHIRRFWLPEVAVQNHNATADRRRENENESNVE